MKTKLIGTFLVLLMIAPVFSHAATLTLEYVDSGWYTSPGFHGPNNENYLAGEAGVHFHNFFVFDLGTVTSPILSATLRVYSGDVVVDATYRTFDVSTPISTLRAGGTGQVGIYNDLGSGLIYGERATLSSEFNSNIDITLNVNALVGLNGARPGLWAIGGDYLTTEGYIYGNTGETSNTRQLILETASSVPEASSSFLLMLALLSLAGYGWRRRQKAA